MASDAARTQWVEKRIKGASATIWDVGTAAFEVKVVLESGSTEYFIGVTPSELLQTQQEMLRVGRPNWLHVINRSLTSNGHAEWAQVARQFPVSRGIGEEVCMKFDGNAVTLSYDSTSLGPYLVPAGKYFPCVLAFYPDTALTIQYRPLCKRKCCESQICDKLFRDRKFTDASIMCGGHQIPVHRCVLAAVSPVFERMLESGMREGHTTTIEIQDVSPEAIEIMVRYIYKGDALPMSTQLSALFVLGNRYMIPSLVSDIGDLMVQQLDKINGKDILHVVRRHATCADEFSVELWDKLTAKLHGDRELMQGVMETFCCTSADEISHH
ncbi:unnamed protein product [Polarella glacialis]|uniref:BTB domain-containing protein n=1 Tax=Polarella glacialis TaxID=89957 RepID=A0A813J7L0_POLGL|nr:unnamed protein product [Polarella glacialis]CAE8672231.1 unnamed protein product [Polarella glacialis]